MTLPKISAEKSSANTASDLHIGVERSFIEVNGRHFQWIPSYVRKSVDSFCKSTGIVGEVALVVFGEISIGVVLTKVITYPLQDTVVTMWEELPEGVRASAQVLGVASAVCAGIGSVVKFSNYYSSISSAQTV